MTGEGIRAGPIRASIDVDLDPSVAFDVVVEELAAGLARAGATFIPGIEGRVLEGEVEVGRVLEWKAGECVVFEWRQANWAPEEITRVELRFEPVDGGTRATLQHYGWGHLIGEADEVAGWFASQVAAPLLQAMAPATLGSWITDRQARRPSGLRARAIYRDPLYHYPNFRAILAELALTSDDHLLEVGCGGGAFLREALESRCTAAAVDHSPDMVRLAREVNEGAVAAGRLEILEASAERLPFLDETFTAATMTGVLGFLPDPVAALAEIRRVLRTGGRVVMMGSDPQLKGTPAAPEPMASRLRFYEDEEFEALARSVGFETARVVRRSLEQHARDVGVPEEQIPLFAGPGAPFLLARKD